MTMLISLAYVPWIVLIAALVAWIGTVLWVGIGLGGLGTRGTGLFNWHPVLASCAMLVLFPHGFLAWRNRRNVSRVQTKWCHATLTIAAFVLLNVAISFAFFGHKQQQLPNFYSLHSWVGMLAIGTMKGNILGGLLSTFSSYVRDIKLVSKAHRLSGYFACVLGFIAMLLGFAEEQRSVVQKSGKAFGPLAIIGGALGLMSLVVGVGVTYSMLFERGNNRDHVTAKNGDEEIPRSSETNVSEYQT